MTALASPFGWAQAALAIVATMAVSPGGRAAAEDWTAALSKPVSPGAVALLATHAAEPAARERLIHALHDPHAEVRAAAARVITVSGLTVAPEELLAALRAEQDLSAAEEEAHALVAVGGPAADAAVVELARQHHDWARNIALALARERGPAAWPRIVELRPLMGAAPLHRLLLHASRGDVAVVTPVGVTAVRDNDVEAWTAVLEVARERDLDVSGLVVSALGSPNAAMRAAAYRHLLVGPRDRLAAPTARDALAASPDAAREGGDDAARALFELVKRARGDAPQGDLDLEHLSFDAPAGQQLERALDQQAVRTLLTPAERRVVGVRFTGSAQAAEEWIKGLAEWEKRAQGKHPPLARTEEAARRRTPSGYPPGLFADVVTVKCEADGDLGAVLVRYGADGRPREISPPAARTSAGCRDATLALGATALDSVDALPRPEPVMLLLPFQRDFLQCMIDEDRVAPEAASAPRERRVAGRIQEPKKVKHVNPVYPASARAAGVQGTVVLDTLVSRAGCIRSLEVVRGVEANLDAAAVAAVAGWRYTPTLVDGRPVPVIMTVTVNFRMH